MSPPTVDDVLAMIAEDRLDAVREALEAGVDVNGIGVFVEKGMPAWVVGSKYSLLTMALMSIRPSIVRLLVEAGADVELSDGRGLLPLQYVLGVTSEVARSRGSTIAEVEGLVRFLLERGASPKTKDPGGGSPWMSTMRAPECREVLFDWALKRSNGDAKKAAKMIGITTRQWTLFNKFQDRWIAAGRPPS